MARGDVEALGNKLCVNQGLPLDFF
jgi:hypothetical protein